MCEAGKREAVEDNNHEEHDMHKPGFSRKIKFALRAWTWNRVIETGVLRVRRQHDVLRGRVAHVIITNCAGNGDLFAIVDMSHDFQARSRGSFSLAALFETTGAIDGHLPEFLERPVVHSTVFQILHFDSNDGVLKQRR